MELLALSDIAKRTGIPAPTARRYAALFKEFLGGRRLGRMTRYPEEALAVFQRISELYTEGRITAEIEEMLRREYPRTIEVGPAAEPMALPAVPQELPANLGEILSDALSEALSSSIAQFSDALERLAEQKTSLDAHQQDISQLKNGFVLLARNLKKVASRGQADLSGHVAKLTERVRLMEPKLAVMEEITLTLTSDNADLKARLAAQEVELRRLREEKQRLEGAIKRANGLPG